MNSTPTPDHQESCVSLDVRLDAAGGASETQTMCDSLTCRHSPIQRKEGENSSHAAVTKTDEEQHLQAGLRYMLAEDGGMDTSSEALAAFDRGISLGNKAMLRKAQLLFDGRLGVKRDATLAVKLFEELKSQGLYLPQIYYYLAKHALERSFGRTTETYQVVSDYFTKIIEMKYDGNEEERKGDGEAKNGDGSTGQVHRVGSVEISKNDDGEETDSKGRKAAILFAQAGIYSLYLREDVWPRPYFLAQLPTTVRQWFKTCDFLKLCLEAKEAGCQEPELYHLIGHAYRQRNQGEEDGEAALDNLNKACDLDIIPAYSTLGDIYSPRYRNLCGYPKDPKKAMLYYQNALSKGFTDGGRLLRRIALLHWYRKDDAEKNGTKVLEYLDQSISQGDELSYYWRAEMYAPDTPLCPPIAKCWKTAHKLRLEAEALGCKHPSLFEKIGKDYMSRYTDKKKVLKSIQYYEKSIEYGGYQGYYNLAPIYDTESSNPHHLPNLKKNDTKAFTYYIKYMEAWEEQGLEEADHSWLCLKIASMYENGRGTLRDYYKAVEYYKKAGEQSVLALIRLGVLYDTAQRLSPYPCKDDQKARRYYKEVYDMNAACSGVYLNLGNMYRDGRGGEVDGEMAIKYYDKAIELECYDAMYEKGVIYDPERKECPPIVKDENIAIQLYLWADGAGCTSKRLRFTLADCYRRGRGGRRDEALAKVYDGCLMDSSMK